VLSKGNRQKVSLCRALVHDPPVLLLDEPTSGLDVVAAAGLEDLLRERDLTGARTVLLSTHRLDEVERMATKVVGIADGRVVVDATPDELVTDTGAETFRDAFVRLLGAAALGGAG
jgi:ABC-type multidrug transport system ATPase subunit